MNNVTNTEVTITGVPAAVFAAYKADQKLSFIRGYDPRTQAVPMFRHAIIRYRVTDGMKAKGTIEKPAQMVTIPQIKLNDDYLLPEKATQVLVGLLEDQQDTMIKQLIESKASVIHWDLLTLDNVLNALTAVRVSQRLTREQVQEWAKIAVKEACTKRAEQIAEAKGTDKAKQVEATLGEYVTSFGALAAAVPNIGEATARALNNMLTLAKVDDDMSRVLAKKLDSILNPELGSNL